MKISLKDAIKELNEGRVIAVPTDTVYGLVARFDDKIAIDRIYELKKRPLSKNLILFIRNDNDLHKFVKETPPFTLKLASIFWPGPLTMVFPSKILGGESIGIRIPNHKTTLSLLEKIGPLLSTSANVSSCSSSINIEQVELSFGEDFPVLDGEGVVKGVESTIILYRDYKWQIIRKGCISNNKILTEIIKLDK